MSARHHHSPAIDAYWGADYEEQAALERASQEREELAAHGLSPDALDTIDQVALKATASRLLRAMAAIEREAKELDALRVREIEHIGSVYGPQIDRLHDRRAMIERIVCDLATRADFGNKRSASLAGGEFGLRKQAAKIDITDDALALAWAAAHVPEAIETVQKLAKRVVAPVVLARISAGDELPPGFDYTAARDVAYARPAER